ncbi:MAG: DUF4129 domain-containing protein [Anaerolineae bacterium]|nr:DUF4129 domain-containing protein [Anaerolineae bacterium]
MSEQERTFWQSLTTVDLSGIDWVKELLYLNLAAMEACVVYPWYLMFNRLAQNQDRAMSLLAVIALLWMPYLLASLLNRTALTADRKQATVAGLMLLMSLIVVRLSIYGGYNLLDLTWFLDLTDRLFGILTSLPPDLILVGVVFVAWWRGIILSRQDYDTRQVGFHFRLGIIILLGYFIVTIFGLRENIVIAVVCYFFFGLLTVALARVIEVGGIHTSSLGSKQWVAILVGASTGSLGLALLALALFSRQVLGAFIDRFRNVWNFIAQIAWYAVGVLLYLFFPLVEWIIELFQQLDRSAGGFGEQLFGSPLEDPLAELKYEEYKRILPHCNTILMVILVVGGLLLIARLIRQILAKGEKDEDIERESMWSLQNLADDLRNSLRQGLDNLRAFMDHFGDRKKRSAASIRKIYASMIDLAGEAGYPRRPAITPYEHRPTLYHAFPGGQEAVDAITEAYVRVHYGQVPDTREAMQQIVRHWETVQQMVVAKEEASKTNPDAA